MRNKDLLKRRNKLIYEKYCDLWKAGQREELIWPVLSVEFHLEESTIYRIVLALIKEANNNQMELKFTSNPQVDEADQILETMIAAYEKSEQLDRENEAN